MPTKKEQKHITNETKRVSKQQQKEKKELEEKEKEMRRLAAQALRKGSSDAGKMMASLKKKSS